MVLLHGLGGDVAPFVEDVGGVVFQLEGDEFLVVRAVHLLRTAIGKIWWEGGGEVSMVFLSFLRRSSRFCFGKTHHYNSRICPHAPAPRPQS